MQFYTSIFRRAWTITRNHPVLWLFGFFTIFWGGKSMDIELFFTNADLLGSASSPFNPAFWSGEKWGLVQNWIAGSTPGVVVAVLGAGVLAVFLLVVIMISQIGLVHAFGRSAKQHDVDVKYKAVDAVHVSRTHLLPVTILNVLGKAAAYALVGIAAVPLFTGNMSSTSQLIWSWALLIVLTPVAIALSIIVKFAVNYVVLNDEDFVVAFWKGWRLFRSNIGVSIELAVVMLFAFAGVNILALIAVGVFALPFLLGATLVGMFTGSYVTLGLVLVLLYMGGILAIVGSSMIFSAWHHGSWTLLFMELVQGKKRSKTHRLWKGE